MSFYSGYQEAPVFDPSSMKPSAVVEPVDDERYLIAAKMPERDFQGCTDDWGGLKTDFRSFQGAAFEL